MSSSRVASTSAAIGLQTHARMAVIINPVAGRGQTAEIARERAAFASDFLASAGIDHEIFLTERVGHAGELARGAVARGASMVWAWGGDGTVSEVAGALAFGPAVLGIVPAGSGNGLARDLGIPMARREAIGEVAGRLFVNVAGIGFDALIASRFAERDTRRRGFVSYLTIAAREVRGYRPTEYVITIGEESAPHTAWMIVLANSRQYGNGACIAPGASLDDGELDLVVVHGVSRWAIVRRVPRLFRGTLATEPGVITIARVTEATIGSDSGLTVHLDGEVMTYPSSVQVRVHPRALKVRAPLV
jgi:diacylglycerol kinase (ATP)